MRDVSRVEYDAALKRVEDGYHCVPAERRCAELQNCTCERLTLAALGLDGPPTEEDTGPLRRMNAVQALLGVLNDIGGGHPWNYNVITEAAEDALDAALAAYAVVPPSETPKACPMCWGNGVMGVMGGSELVRCSRCDGSGIDGGTA